MEPREYFSARTGAVKPDFDLSFLRKQLLNTYLRFERLGHFQEYLGYYCVDNQEVLGTIGMPVEVHLEGLLYKLDLWPIAEHVDDYSEDDVMDMIEFLFDHSSKGVEGEMHYYNDCGMHYRTFDQTAGQVEFREWVNRFLRKYGSGFELTEDGRVVQLIDSGVKEFVEDKSTLYGSDALTAKVETAKAKFRRYNATPADKRDAVRDLADVLEYQRKSLGAVLSSKDDGDLFHIANNFGIRHHNDKQKTSYDEEVWLDWMFFYYLATIQATSRLLAKQP